MTWIWLAQTQNCAQNSLIGFNFAGHGTPNKDHSACAQIWKSAETRNLIAIEVALCPDREICSILINCNLLVIERHRACYIFSPNFPIATNPTMGFEWDILQIHSDTNPRGWWNGCKIEISKSHSAEQQRSFHLSWSSLAAVPTHTIHLRLSLLTNNMF